MSLSVPPLLQTGQTAREEDVPLTSLFILNGILFGMIHLFLIFAVPVLASKYAESESPAPAATVFIVDWAGFCWRSGWATNVFVGVSAIYFVLKAPKQNRRRWLWCAALVLALILAFSVFSMFLPTSQLGPAAGAPR